MADTTLEEFVEAVNGTSHLRVEHDFGDGFVRLRTSEAERRQAVQDIRCVENIVLELLRNSRDAHATKIFVAMSRDEGKRLLTVIDDGEGVPASMHEHVFEPRVTSKLDTAHRDAWGMHGRGMALYSISVNAKRARIESSDTGLGCSVGVEVALADLPEKSDQSSFPTFVLGEDSTVHVRGPRNILRTACEFAIECRSACDVYVGSPSEIAASMYYYGMATLSAIDRAFCRDVEQLPIVKRLATASDPASFVAIAASMGIDLSERTARRIMNGEVELLDPLLGQVELTKDAQKAAKQTLRRKRAKKAIKLERDDVDALKGAVKEAYADLARRYYLEPGVDPNVRSLPDRITITLPVIRKDS